MFRFTTLFDQLYKRMLTPSVRYAYSLLGSYEVAEDVVQDVFLKLGTTQGAAEPPSPQYIRAMVRNKAIDRLRRLTRERDYLQGEGATETARVEGDTPEMRLLRRERQKAAHAALHALPDLQRQVFILRKFKGMSYDDIARKLGISQSSAIRSMRLAITALATTLDEGSDMPEGDAP